MNAGAALIKLCQESGFELELRWGLPHPSDDGCDEFNITYKLHPVNVAEGVITGRGLRIKMDAPGQESQFAPPWHFLCTIIEKDIKRVTAKAEVPA